MKADGYFAPTPTVFTAMPGLVERGTKRRPSADLVVAMITQEDGEALWIFNIDSSTGKVLAAR